MNPKKPRCLNCNDDGRVYDDDGDGDWEFCHCRVGRREKKNYVESPKLEIDDGGYSSSAGYGGWGHDP